MKTSIIAVLLLGLLPIILSAQEPRGASLEGIVVRAETGEPLERAVATLTMQERSSASQRIPSANTSRDGRFIFQNLEPGLYSLQVNCNGYIRQNYDLHVVGGPATGIRLAAGQSVKGIIISLVQAGYVSGVIRNADGEPQKGVTVAVLSATLNSNGQKSFYVEAAIITDDRGEYRVYWIAPGRYYVRVTARPGPSQSLNPNGAPPTPNRIPDQNFAPTYFPGVLDVNAAATVEVVSGAAANVDIVVPLQ